MFGLYGQVYHLFVNRMIYGIQKFSLQRICYMLVHMCCVLYVVCCVLCVVCCVVCGMCYVGVEMIQYVVIVHILKFFYCFNTCLSGVYRLVTLKPTTYQSVTGIFSIYLQQKHSYSLSTGEKRTTATVNKQYKAKKSGVISSYCFVCIFFNEFTLSPVSTFYFSV